MICFVHKQLRQSKLQRPIQLPLFEKEPNLNMVNAVFSKKDTGSFYTPKLLADFVAKQLFENFNGLNPKILDPACGDGQLLQAIHKYFPSSSLFGVDNDKNAIKTASEKLAGDFRTLDFLDEVLNAEEGLFSSYPKDFDLVIANPPYIRTQILGAEKAQRISKLFNLKGRIDIYFAFLKSIGFVLKEGGLASVIVSNRFMTTKAGSSLRNVLLDTFDIIHIWDFGDTRLFEAAVLPAVLLLRKKGNTKSSQTKMTSIYTSDKEIGLSANDPFEVLDQEGFFKIGKYTFEIKQGVLDHLKDTWTVTTKSSDRWLDTVSKNTFCKFGDIGKIRVGLKTTADGVFVKEIWGTPKPELLMPLVTSECARPFKAKPSFKEVLYTHETLDGKRCPVSLERYPISEKYLKSHFDVLNSRSYIHKAKRKWFEIWVPHYPHLWKEPKIIFPDISEKPVFWISTQEECVQGNCYWITPEGSQDLDILWLALGIGNSKFIEIFYDHSFNNKLYAGRRRFMTQYVEHFPLPNPNTNTSKDIIKLSKTVFEKQDLLSNSSFDDELNNLVAKSFGL